MAMNAEQARRLPMQGATPMPPPYKMPPRYKQSMSLNERELYEQLERMRGGGQDLRMDNSGQARDHGLLDHIDVEKHAVGEVVLFDESELKEGAAKTLRRVETPKVGQRFDTNKMLVDMVLVLNRMVAVVEEQAETIHDLGEQVRDLELKVYAGKSEPKEEIGDFKLPSLAANYDDVEKP